jgi:hypothetical protein
VVTLPSFCSCPNAKQPLPSCTIVSNLFIPVPPNQGGGGRFAAVVVISSCPIVTRTSSRKRTRPQSYINESYSEGETIWKENGELVRGINIIEQIINAHMKTDDNDNEARIVSIYHMLNYPYPRTTRTMRTYPPGAHSMHRTRISSKKLFARRYGT